MIRARPWGKQARSVTALRRSLDRISGLASRALPVARLGARRISGHKSPFQMTLSLTNRCNFRCEYCNIPLQPRDEMSTAEWIAAIDDLCAAGMGRASLMGGEPLLRRDAGEIVDHLKRRGVHASMNTNGWLVPARLDEVAALDLVCVTLDGPPLVHDRQRHPGSYARAIEAIEALRGRGVTVVTMTVVTPATLGVDCIEHVLDVARAHRLRAFFQIEHQADFDVVLPVAPRLSDGRVRALAERLMALKDRGQPVGNSRSILEAQRRRRYLGACADCHAGRYYGYVLSDGTVAPCLFTQGQVPRGNGRERGFARAFAELPAPAGPGCSCVPTHEVNAILDLDAGVLFDALDLALSGR
jgi:MoaA/NifB/PqqE/SkfB family radical SAM enzyme